jgi:hypothetical protein
MQATGTSTIPTKVAALLLAALTTLNIAWAQAIPDEKPLTEAQQASIREEMAALGAVLVGGGKTEQEAKLAAHAVGTCIGTGYSYGLTRQQADRVCGLVLDAFIIQPGATFNQLTPDDRAWLSARVVGWTDELATVLEPDQVGAVRSTMHSCLESYLERGEGRVGAVSRCAEGLLPMLDMPGLRQRLLEAASKLP